MSRNDMLSYETMRKVALEIVQLGRDVPEEEWFNDAEHYAVSQTSVNTCAFLRWDEKAGLRRDAIRSQGSARSRRNGKETGL
jgi:hypothetical protein